MKEGGDGRNLLDQQYPRELAQRVCCPPQHLRRSFRTRWERRPGECRVSFRSCRMRGCPYLFAVNLEEIETSGA